MEKTTFKTKLKRVLKSGFFNFWRSSFVSISSILVMVITLFVIGSVLFMGALLNLALDEIRDKVDVNVYFVTQAKEEEIFGLKKKIEMMPEVASVTYVSREEALQNFKTKHANDSITLQALEELSENPLGALLNIKAKEPSQYESLAGFLNQESSLYNKDGIKIIDKINYFENKIAIEKLSRIISSADKLGVVISALLVIVSIVITFNTIRLVIFVSKEEISVMQLVGASKNYIRGPFVVTGVLVGLFSAIITLVLFFPILYWLGGITTNFFVGLNIFDYYLDNMFQVCFIILGSGIGIGALSSFLAVRKYLKL